MSHRIAAYLEDSPRVVAMPCSLVVDRLEEAWYVDRDCHDHDGQEVVGQDLTRETGLMELMEKARMFLVLPSARYGVPCWPCSTKSDVWRYKKIPLLDILQAR